MKKTLITIAILLGLSLGAFAQGGLFRYGAVPDEEYYNSGAKYDEGGLLNFSLPNSHGSDTDQNAAPLGSGALLLIGFGAAYALKQRKTT